jgi:hypothetical protein
MDEIVQNLDLPGPLLCHRSISQDQQVLCTLQQISKGLQAAVAAEGIGQVHIALSTARVQQADACVAWLHKHAGLLQQLELDLVESQQYSGSRDWRATRAALAAALQHAAAAGCLLLRSFSLKGSIADASVMGPLAAAQLTHLAIDTPTCSETDVGAVAAFTALRSLELRGNGGIMSLQRSPPDAPASLGRSVGGLASLLVQLEHRTQLRIGPIFPAELTHLSSLSGQTRLRGLQQLHLTVAVAGQQQQLLELAEWVAQHGSLVRSLTLVDFRSSA